MRYQRGFPLLIALAAFTVSAASHAAVSPDTDEACTVEGFSQSTVRLDCGSPIGKVSVSRSLLSDSGDLRPGKQEVLSFQTSPVRRLPKTMKVKP